MTDTDPRPGPGFDGDLDFDLDLTPHAPVPSAGNKGRRRSYRNVAIVSVLAMVLGVVLYQALTSARVYFLNVDEAVTQRSDLGQQNFRMQGELVAVDGTDSTGALLFTLTYGDGSAAIRHVGDEPSNMFDVGESIVVEGYWDGQVFLSNQILVKHSEEYIEDNPERLADSNYGSDYGSDYGTDSNYGTDGNDPTTETGEITGVAGDQPGGG